MVILKAFIDHIDVLLDPYLTNPLWSIFWNTLFLICENKTVWGPIHDVQVGSHHSQTISIHARTWCIQRWNAVQDPVCELVVKFFSNVLFPICLCGPVAGANIRGILGGLMQIWQIKIADPCGNGQINARIFEASFFLFIHSPQRQYCFLENGNRLESCAKRILNI